MVRFTISARDALLVKKIVKRLAGMSPTQRDPMEYRMDLTAAHANGCPMDFERLLGADDFNFLHDVFGIERHLDRATGKLQNSFHPRFAKKERSRA